MKKIMLCMVSVLVLFSFNVKFEAEEFNYNEDYKNNNSSQYIEDVVVDNTYSLKSNDKLMAENNNLALYFNEQTAMVIIYDKQADYYWTSSPEVVQGNVNDYYKRIISSPVIITYADEELNEKTTALLDEGNAYTVDKIDNGFTMHVTFLEEIKFDINFTLSNEELLIEIPFDKIVDGETVNLVSVEVLPFLGASYEDDIAGYFVVPDGVGQIMEFKEADSTIKSAYQEEIYGSDFGIDIENFNYSVYTPLIGTIHGEHDQGFSRYITSGQQNAEVLASPAGYITNYNYETFIYNYRFEYYLELSEDKVVKQFTEMYNVNFTEHISFLENDNADYVGIAKEYRDYLKTASLINETGDYTYKVMLDTYMQTLNQGSFSNHDYNLTTYQDIVDINNVLKENGVNAQFVINAYNKGANSTMLGSSNKINTSIEEGLSKKEFEESAQQNGVDYRYSVNLLEVEDGANGFSARKDFSKAMTKELIEFCHGGPSACNYEIDANTAATHLDIEKLLNNLENQKLNILLPYIHTNENQIQNKITYNDDIATVLSQFSGYDYSVEFRSTETNLGATEITYVPYYAASYSYFDGQIPLLPLILSGSSALYSENLNYEITNENLLLNLVEYDIYPMYGIVSKNLSEQDSDILEIADYQTFSVLQDKIITVNTFVQPAFDAIGNSEMVDHEVVMDQLVKVDYSNGVTVLINYKNAPQVYENTTVPAKNYKVIGADNNEN